MVKGGADSIVMCAVRQLHKLTVFAVFRSITGQVGQLLREAGDTVLFCAIGKSNDMTVFAVCHSVTESGW